MAKEHLHGEQSAISVAWAHKISPFFTDKREQKKKIKDRTKRDNVTAAIT